MRKKCHHANVFRRSTQLYDGVDGLATRIEINDYQLWPRLQQTQHCVGGGGHLEFNAEMLGGLRNFHLKKNVVHQRYDAAHRLGPLPTIMPAYWSADSQLATGNGYDACMHWDSY
jgi:hypothetical protein